MAEFTGERLIPGQVDIDLLNEHMARYTFAVRLARGKRVLDAGCGAGYGSAELARVAERVTGIDVAAEAVEYALAHYAGGNLAFEQASATSLPYPDASFDLVVAFEMIEHLEDWRGFLSEARRVMTASGQLIVSTPNRLYYTESRGAHGANPFHVHEFDFAEFSEELRAVFPHVSLYLENHVEGVAFTPHEPGNTVEARLDAGEAEAAESHFFVAVCAHRPQLGNPAFLYVPRSANVLREREHHIAALEKELALKDGWLKQAQADLAGFDGEHQKLLAMFREQKEELEKSNRWAEELNALVGARDARILELQQELARDQENARQVVEGYNRKIAALEQENREQTQWAVDTEKRLATEIARLSGELVLAVEAIGRTEKELEERTAWALKLDQEKGELEQQLAMVRLSRWVRLGRKVGL
ncbi:MAG: methyltransferase domain-containing protein, partial [Acidobacteriota bacterium]|nr:methyltransferase domain-containing protein [Acidobacteriota bacterium]